MPTLAEGFNTGIAAMNDMLKGRKLRAELPYAGMTAEADAAYKQAMAKYLMNPNQNLKYLSGMGKTFVEPAVINAYGTNGLPYGSNQNGNTQNTGLMAPPAQSGMPLPTPGNSVVNDAYAAQRQKMTSDVQTRNRAKFVENIDKTLSTMDPAIFDKYSGVGGSLRLMKDKANSVFGETSPDYKKYNNFVKVQIPILAKQIRQFYGDSIQPSVSEALKDISNPITWKNNPELAQAQFKQLVDLLKMEGSTYTQNLNAPIPVENQNIQPQNDSGIVQVNLSGFKSKQEFQNWFKKQTPDVQQAVVAQLKGGG